MSRPRAFFVLVIIALLFLFISLPHPSVAQAQDATPLDTPTETPTLQPTSVEATPEPTFTEPTEEPTAPPDAEVFAVPFIEPAQPPPEPQPLFAAQAASSSSPEGNPIANEPQPENRPDVAFNSVDRQYLVTWIDEGAVNQIKGRLLDLNGSPVGSSFTVATRSVGAIAEPELAYSSASNSYLVVWAEPNGLVSVESYCLGTCITYSLNRYNLYAMPLAADGTPLAASPILLTNQVTKFNYTESMYDLAYNSGQNEFLVDWNQPRGGFISNIAQPSRVVAQRLGTDGSLHGAQVVLVTAVVESNQLAYSLASNEYLVLFNRYPSSSLDYEVYYQRFRGDTLAAKGGSVNITSAAGGQNFGGVAYDPNKDRYLVIWWDGSQSPAQVKERLVQAGTGTPLGVNTIVIESTDGAVAFQPYVGYSSVEVQYMVVAATQNGIKGRNVSDEGAAGASAFTIASGGLPGGIAARVGGEANAPRWMVMWESAGDIFSQAFPLVTPPTPTPTATLIANPPVASKSIYVHSKSADFKLYGCDEATYGPNDAFVILDFGQPWAKTQNGQSVPEVRTWNRDEFTIPQVEAAIQDYSTSYWNCATKAPIQKHVTLAVGLNNDSANQNFVTAAHGQAWRDMINDLNIWIRLRSCGLTLGQQQSGRVCPIKNYVSIVAAMDIEMSGAAGRLSPQESRDWVQGYAASNPVPSLYNFGTCQDCPYQGPYPLPPQSIVIPSTNPQWTYDDVWYLSWGVVPSPTPTGPPPGLANLRIYPLPEIYSGIQPTVFPTPYHAKQWSQLSDYGSGRGNRMWFFGVITQFTACSNGQGTPIPIEKDTDGTCYPYYVPGTDQHDTTRMTNKPNEGWQQLQDLVANYQTPIRWVTDIGWSYNYDSGWRP